MKYELAKQLKDAGFPKIALSQYIYPSEKELLAEWEPTLSELIEACGDKFESLYKIHGIERSDFSVKSNGVAGGYEAIPIMAIEEICDWQWGNTPEEAVAKLWLALNKKD